MTQDSMNPTLQHSKLINEIQYIKSKIYIEKPTTASKITLIRDT